MTEKDLFRDSRPSSRPGKEAFFKALQEMAAAAASLDEFLRLVSVYDPEAEKILSESEPHLPRVMTMHQSKGLEFDCVFLPGLNEGTIPVRNCSG